MSTKGKSIKTESRFVVAQGWRGGEKWGVTANGQEVSLGDDKNVLKLWWWLHNSVNILNTAEVYTSNG